MSTPLNAMLIIQKKAEVWMSLSQEVNGKSLPNLKVILIAI